MGSMSIAMRTRRVAKVSCEIWQHGFDHYRINGSRCVVIKVDRAILQTWMLSHLCVSFIDILLARRFLVIPIRAGVREQGDRKESPLLYSNWPTKSVYR